MRPRIIAVAVIVFACACRDYRGDGLADASSVTDAGDERSDGDGGPDANVDSSTDALIRDDFASGCSGWLATGATLTPSGAGNGSCKLCFAVDPAYAHKTVPIEPSVARYELTVSTQADGAGAGDSLDVGVRFFDVNAKPVGNHTQTVTVPATFAQASADGDSVASATTIEVDIGVSVAGHCIDFDDVTLVKK